MFERYYAESQTFRDNIRFLCQFRLGSILRHLIDDMHKGQSEMATFEDDETRLEADIAAQGAAITQIKTTLDSNAAQIATLKEELAAQQSQGDDTTRLEAAISTLEANNATLSGLTTPAPTS